MLKSIEVYLVTDGNGEEAVEFYRDALGAELVYMTKWGEHVPDCPPERANLVLNAQLSVNGIRLMISDENPDFEYTAGSNMTAALITDDAETAHELYKKLSVNAKSILMEMQETFWSPAYAGLTDQFGMNWQISAEVEGFVPTVE